MLWRKSQETASPSFISSKLVLSMNWSQSHSKTKKERLSIDDETMFSEQDEQVQSDDDEDIF